MKRMRYCGGSGELTIVGNDYRLAAKNILKRKRRARPPKFQPAWLLPFLPGSGAYLAAALMKGSPFGVPKPVTLSQPGATTNEVSVPKLRANQEPLNGLL